jgi:hypothetical protein
VAEVDGPADGEAGQPDVGRRSRRTALIVAGVAAVVLTAAALVFVHWRNGLRLFNPAGNEVGADQVPIGRTFYVPQVWSPVDRRSVRLKITEIEPAVTVNGAHADIRVVMCTLRPGLTAAFMDDWSLTRWCTSVLPFTPGRYRLSGLGPSSSAVLAVVAVTPRTIGRVHIAGVRVRYEQGLRRGDQRVGIEVDTRTR